MRALFASGSGGRHFARYPHPHHIPPKIRMHRCLTRRTDLKRLIPGNNLEDATLFYLQQSVEIHAAVHNVYD
jgi:hypothetical protein